MGTELRIVNAMLSAVGEGAMNDLDSQHPSVIKARDFIATKNEEFQATDWWFNTDTRTLMTRTTDLEILIPDEVTRFRIDESVNWTAKKGQLVQRGRKLYDSVASSYKIPGDVRATYSVMLPIVQLPSTAFTYLLNNCTFQFYEDDDGDIGKAQRLEQRAVIAWQNLKTEHLQNMKVNAFDNPQVRALMYNTGGYSVDPRIPGGRMLSR